MFKEGFNCAQAVLTCCGEQYGIDHDTACRVAQTLGGGMSRLNQTCGAVTGALMVIGLKHAKTGADNKGKEQAMQFAQEFARRFRAKHGSLSCTELLGCDLSTKEGFSTAMAEGLTKTICPQLVRDAADIVDELLRTP